MDKKNKNPFIKFILISFIIFLIIYFTKETGYYEYKLYTKTKLTQESINKFEEDIKNNKDITINDYVVNEYIDYSNKFTNAGCKIGSFTEKIMNFCIKKSLKLLNDLFYK